MIKYLSTTSSAAIFLVFTFALLRYSLNIPSFDDYDATLGFIKQFYFDNESVAEAIKILFAKHNEHRILFSKLVAASYFALFHEINFAHLIIIQNVFLTAFFGVILKVFREEKQLNSTVLLLITAFLFNFSFWQVSFYYWAGIQHYTVFFFSFTSLLLLSKSENRVSAQFIGAILMAVFAVFSFGNGFIVLCLGAFLLFSQKKYNVLSWWIIFSLVLCLVIFFVQIPTNQKSQTAPFNIEWMSRLLFTFTGSFLYVNPSSYQYVNIVICMAAGFAILVFWIWLFFSGYAFRKPLLYSLISFPILTGIIISISRFETKSAGGVAPRYMFFTASIPVLLIIILLDLKLIKKQSVGYLTAVVLILWSLSAYNNIRALKNNNNEIISTLEKWEKDKSTPLVYYHKPGEYSHIMDWAIEYHVLRNSKLKNSIQHIGE